MKFRVVIGYLDLDVENRRCLSIKKWHCWTVCKIMGLSVRLKIATPCKVHFIFKCKTFQIVIACELKEKWFKEKKYSKKFGTKNLRYSLFENLQSTLITIIEWSQIVKYEIRNQAMHRLLEHPLHSINWDFTVDWPNVFVW